MDKTIRSMPTFVFGVIMVGLGLAVAVAEISPLRYGDTTSVAGLVGGAVVLVAAIMAPRASASPAAPSPVRGVDGAPWIEGAPTDVDPFDLDPTDLDPTDPDPTGLDPTDPDEQRDP